MRRQLCIACFIAGIAAFAHADTLTLTVGDANATNTLSEALSAVGRTVADLNGGDYAAYDIVKAGDGVLKMDASLASFSGNITISAGRVIACAASALGNATGVTRVNVGATLVCDNSSNALNIRNSGKVVLDGGTGYPGEGGQLVSLKGNAATTGIRDVVPSELELAGSATWSIPLSTDGYVIFEQAYITSVNVSVHTLTIVNTLSSKSDNPKYHVYCYGTTFMADDGGGIVVDGLVLDAGHTSDKYSTFRGPGFFRCKNSGFVKLVKSAGFVEWKLYAANEKEDSSLANLYYSANDVTRAGEPFFAEQFLSGDMELAKDFAFGWHSASTWATFGVRGKVSGTGGFKPNVSDNANYTRYGLFLGGDENDFSGGITGFHDSWVALGGIRAAGTGNVELKDSTLQFFCTEKSNGVYRLPATELYGTTLVRADGAKNGFNATSLTLAANASVTANATVVHADALSLGEGSTLTLRNPAASHAAFRSAFAGLYTGGIADANTPCNIRISSITTAPFNKAATNIVERVPSPFNAPSGEWTLLASPEVAYQTASGYIWNDSPNDTVWTFCCTLCAKWELVVGDNAAVQNATVNYTGMSPKIVNLTLKPGANRFVFRMANQYGPSYAGHTATNGLTNWNAEYGLVYDKQGRMSTDGNDYMPFSSSEAMPLFTTVAEAPATDYYFGSIVGSGTIDLNGATMRVGSIADTVTVVNGTVVFAVADAASSVSLGGQSGALVSLSYLAARAESAGLWTGTKAATDGGSTVWNLGNFNNHPNHALTFTNSIAYSPEKFYLTYDESYNNATYFRRFNTYDGYIWNNTGSAVNWHVLHTLYDYVEISIGESSLAATEIDSVTLAANNRNSISLDATLQPGPNRITIRTYDRYGNSSGYVFGNICTNDLTNWTDAFGLAYSTDATTKDKSDYTALIDAGDGMLFTRSIPENPSCAGVSGLAGSVADLGYLDWTIGTVTGPVAFSNGNVTVANALAISAAELVSDDYMSLSNGSLVFAPGADLTFDTKPEKSADGYVVAVADEIVGEPGVPAVLAEKWKLVRKTAEDGREMLCLVYDSKGFIISFR